MEDKNTYGCKRLYQSIIDDFFAHSKEQGKDECAVAITLSTT